MARSRIVAALSGLACATALAFPLVPVTAQTTQVKSYQTTILTTLPDKQVTVPTTDANGALSYIIVNVQGDVINIPISITQTQTQSQSTGDVSVKNTNANEGNTLNNDIAGDTNSVDGGVAVGTVQESSTSASSSSTASASTASASTAPESTATSSAVTSTPATAAGMTTAAEEGASESNTTTAKDPAASSDGETSEETSSSSTSSEAADAVAPSSETADNSSDASAATGEDPAGEDVAGQGAKDEAKASDVSGAAEESGAEAAEAPAELEGDAKLAPAENQDDMLSDMPNVPVGRLAGVAGDTLTSDAADEDASTSMYATLAGEEPVPGTFAFQNGERSLRQADTGEWQVDESGRVTFTGAEGFAGQAGPTVVKAEGKDGSTLFVAFYAYVVPVPSELLPLVEGMTGTVSSAENPFKHLAEAGKKGLLESQKEARKIVKAREEKKAEQVGIKKPGAKSEPSDAMLTTTSGKADSAAPGKDGAAGDKSSGESSQAAEKLTTLTRERVTTVARRMKDAVDNGTKLSKDAQRVEIKSVPSGPTEKSARVAEFVG